MKKSLTSSGTSAPLLALLFLTSTGCSDSGDPPAVEAEPANPWNGRTYYLEIPRTHWSEPRGIGSDISEYVPGFLLRVEGEEPESFQVMMGPANAEGAQNTCTMTSHVSGTAELPGAAIGPSEFPLHIQHVRDPIVADGTVYGLTITNALPDGNTISEIGEFVGTMDFRQIYQLFTAIINVTPEAVCTTLMQQYGTGCAACPTDQEPYCLTVKAIDLGAVPYDEELEPIDAVDPSCVPPPAP